MKITEVQQTITAWHITDEKNLSSIKAHGVEPRIGPNSQDIGETAPAIHVFLDWNSLEDAMMNWESMSWHDENNGDLVVLTLEVPREMVQHVGPPLLGGTGVIYDSIPPDMIKQVAEIY